MSFKILGGTLVVTLVGGFALASVGMGPVIEALGPKWGPKCDEIMATNPQIALRVKYDDEKGFDGLEGLTAEEWRVAALEEAGCDLSKAPEPAGDDTQSPDPNTWEATEQRWKTEEERQMLEDIVAEHDTYEAGGWGD